MNFKKKKKTVKRVGRCSVEGDGSFTIKNVYKWKFIILSLRISFIREKKTTCPARSLPPPPPFSPPAVPDLDLGGQKWEKVSTEAESWN